MKSILFVVLIASAALTQSPASNGKAVHNINLTAPRDISDAAEVNDAISVLVKDTSHCPAETSRDRKACACSFTHDLKKLKSAYTAAATKHPGWIEEQAVVSYQNAANGNSVVLNLSAIKQQLNACAQPQQ
jgi:hypothetical protein